jgi:biotin transporter BioY
MNGPVEQSDTCSHLNCSHDDHVHHEDSKAAEISTPNHVPEEAFSRLVGFMDIAGVFASTLCTVHCLLLPIIVLLLPIFANHLMHHDYVHVGLAGFVLTFCLMAYVPGYLTHHDKRLIWIGLVGVSLVFFATFIARQWGETIEATIITAGNTCIIFGHLLNRRLLAHLKCKHH